MKNGNIGVIQYNDQRHDRGQVALPLAKRDQFERKSVVSML